MFKPVPVGDRTRYSYARINEILAMPHLIDIQRKSYEWFIQKGLMEILHDISPIKDFAGNLELYFESFELGAPKYSVEECKERDESYSAPMNVKARLVFKDDSGEMKESSVFMGDFPLMTDTGTFVINGAERVIVSQLVRSPGVYYSVTMDPSGKKIYGTTVIPNRGAWIEYETDINDIISARVDRTRKVPATVLLRALGLSSNDEIIACFGNHPALLATLEKDTTTNKDEAMLELYRKLRPGEPVILENAVQLIENTFFDSKRYDLANVGRYKLNKKLGWRNRLSGTVLAEPIVNEETGEIILPEGTKMTDENLDKIEESGVYSERGLRAVKVKNHEADMLLMFTTGIDAKLHTVTQEDVFTSFNYLLNLMDGHGTGDDIDHLGNRRVRCVGELLQNQFRIGLSRMERVVKERMTIQDNEAITPQALINIRPVVAAIKEFFGSSQLSQFMDQNNPLAELTHKRRLSALGPGGLSRERAGYEVRDVHNSHYGRMCPIETPEGPNIGLIGSLSTYAVINEYGFMETPYRVVDKANKRVTEEIRYMTADEEDKYIVAQANEPLDDDGYFMGERVTARAKDDVLSITPDKVDLMDVSPKQVVSIATALIPFLENDDANRALMGANMQRQAVPLLCTQAPIIGTGMEYKVASDSGVCVLAKRAGEVIRVVGNEIRVRAENGEVDVYPLLKFKRSNQGTCVNQRPIVFKGDKVVEKQILADGPATNHGELALGHNVIVAYMPWEGYNYEDAVLLNEDLVKADIFTSIHIEEYDCDARDTKLGKEEITREIPNVSDEALKDLDERGIIRIGAEVRPGDILVGKVTPKGETELTAEERLLRAIFGEKAREVRDSSLRVPHGEAGKIVSVKVFSRENGDDLPPGVNEQVRVHIAQKRKISEGDKMAGRHGNKGVVSRIMAREDMPFLPTGEPVHIVLNPLGVPSRMNIGQVLENHLGWAARALGMEIDTTNLAAKLNAVEKTGAAEGTPEFEAAYKEELANSETAKKLEHYGYDYEKYGMPETVEIDKFGGKSVKAVQISVPVFDGAHEQDIADALELAGIDKTAKTTLYDGRTGEPFDNPVTVGLTYYLKLHHLVDDKIHARSTGPYSLVTQQPLGGKAQFGGQRFGEMEVWALEAYGAAYTLQEILTVKSDDVVGRVKTYEAIVKGENVPDPGIPESFKVLVKELQSIGLDIKVLNEDEEEVSLRDDDDEDIATTAREMDMDINGQVIENAPEKPVDDYADNDATEDVSDSGDIIADMGNFTITDNPDGDLNDPDNM
ncbi:dNA-directed RNA polymerase subunit beta [Phascolarctobacterium succinatutens CAG:287]|uniref:DNA-directed RNA polymerase subunit beta n=1 Tax=Phascolarctobacterium succinatutens CAG:287 TaxID=1263101 RepID=R6XVG4_9FIRM|nr:DNA-directed RNA polymerase subunit beta [Phascolarctobacterium succinatutens]CDD10272.1 dNA-directed RNA polymerase subunit beta [Phascolarctobacterium succinatutens CAG:287]